MTDQDLQDELVAYALGRIDQPAIDAAWDEVCAAHPRPDTSAGRRRWLAKHRDLLNATYHRILDDRANNRPGATVTALTLFDLPPEETAA